MLELDPEVVALLESDAIIVVGTVDAEGIPDAARGWGLRVLERGEPRVRLLLPVAATRARANLDSTGRIAITVTDVATLRSAQVKGRAERVEATTDDDVHLHRQMFAGLREAIHTSEGTPYDIVDRLRPGPLVAAIATIEECYDQTPGPAAGRRLAPSPETP